MGEIPLPAWQSFRIFMTPLHLPIENYPQLLAEKQQRLQTLLTPYQAPAVTCFASPRSHYRQRAEFRIWHEGADLYPVMFNPINRSWCRVDHFPAASQLINRLMPEIMNGLRETPALRYKLFRIDYLSSLSGAGLVTLLYHRPITTAWIEPARQLRDRVQQSLGINLQLVGRALKQCISIDHPFIDEVLSIQGRQFHYRQVEGTFTQPNAQVNCQMLSWACDMLAGSTGDLLELYCGSGNFTLPLAQHFRQVLATEVVKAAVQAAHHNLAVNQIDNVHVVRLSASELLQALRRERTFRRLAAIHLGDFLCQTVLVDPPRSGLEAATLHWIHEVDQILYFSCNPNTLADNLSVLSQTHAIIQCALFDQFPYTNHSECGVLLKRR
jgi:tRNA (uracil-5-)-methyltransferase